MNVTRLGLFIKDSIINNIINNKPIDVDEIMPFIEAMNLDDKRMLYYFAHHYKSDPNYQYLKTKLKQLSNTTKNYDDGYRPTLWLQAARYNQLELMRKILLENPNQDFNEALYDAIKYEYMDMIYFLLENGADPNYQDKQGDTHLHYCLYYWAMGDEYGRNDQSAYDTIRRNQTMLLIRYGADIYIKNNFGITPLNYSNSRLLDLVDFYNWYHTDDIKEPECD